MMSVMGLEPVDLEYDKLENGHHNKRADIGAATYLDGLGIKLESLLLVSQELLDILSLVSLQLNHLAHLSVRDNGAIAS